MERKLIKKKNGFTLVELIVATATFSMLVVTVTGVGVSMIKSQRKAFAMQKAQETGRYILEAMSKEIRMGLVNTGTGDALSSLNITNSNGDDVVYSFDAGTQALMRESQVISPDAVEVTGSFYVRKNTLPTRVAVTIVMKVVSNNEKIEEQAEVYLQNTITPRTY